MPKGGASWAIVWHCIAEFYSIVTHPKIFDPPSTPAQAIAQIEAWLESPALRLLAETDASWPFLKDTLEQAVLRGPRVYDGRIASLCLEHGVSSLLTADRDFSAFPRLTTQNPLDG